MLCWWRPTRRRQNSSQSRWTPKILSTSSAPCWRAGSGREHNEPTQWPIGCAPGWAVLAFWLRTCLPDRAGVLRLTDASLPRMTPGHEASDAIPGRRAVLEALRARRPLRKILIGRTTHGGTIRDILEEARRQDIVVQFVDGRRLDSLTHAARHQGVVALTSVRPLVSVEDVLAAARARQQPPFVLVLDGVEDPANLGAIIRTAEGAGVHGAIIPKHRAARLPPAA